MHRRKEMVLFKGLSEPNMQAMIKRMKVKSFKDGEKIVEQGTIGTTMYFIDLGGDVHVKVLDVCTCSVSMRRRHLWCSGQHF